MDFFEDKRCPTCGGELVIRKRTSEHHRFGRCTNFNDK